VYAATDQFLAALRHSHDPIFYVDAYRGGVRVTPAAYQQNGLPIIPGGTVTVDSSSNVRRACSLTIADPGLSPQVAQDLLTPYGTELVISRGIEYPNGTQEWVPLGWFRIDSAKATDSGQEGATGVQVTGSDRSAYIADDQFTAPAASTASTVVAEIRALVTDAMPSHVPAMVDLTGDTTTCPAQVYDGRDRAAAINTLAAAIGAELVIAPSGTPTLRDVPVATTPPVWTIDAGAAGVLLRADTSIDRGPIYNGWVVTGERTDGTAGAYALVTDSNPASSTYWGGVFGKKPGFFSSPVLTTTAACTAAGTALLARSAGAGWRIELASLVNPALDGSDVVAVLTADLRYQIHIVDQFTVPLDVEGSMPVRTRTNDPAGT
jgi:kumamolisin